MLAIQPTSHDGGDEELRTYIAFKGRLEIHRKDRLTVGILSRISHREKTGLSVAQLAAGASANHVHAVRTYHSQVLVGETIAVD